MLFYLSSSALPFNLTTTALPSPATGQSSFSLIPSGQLSLTEAQLPGQPIRVEYGAPVNASVIGPSADINTNGATVVNGGRARQGEGWAEELGRESANRYFASAFCSW
jgi:alpha,alpha-trehalase